LESEWRSSIIDLEMIGTDLRLAAREIGSENIYWCHWPSRAVSLGLLPDYSLRTRFLTGTGGLLTFQHLTARTVNLGQIWREGLVVDD